MHEPRELLQACAHDSCVSHLPSPAPRLCPSQRPKQGKGLQRHLQAVSEGDKSFVTAANVFFCSHRGLMILIALARCSRNACSPRGMRDLQAVEELFLPCRPYAAGFSVGSAPRTVCQQMGFSHEGRSGI